MYFSRMSSDSIAILLSKPTLSQFVAGFPEKLASPARLFPPRFGWPRPRASATTAQWAGRGDVNREVAGRGARGEGRGAWDEGWGTEGCGAQESKVDVAAYRGARPRGKFYWPGFHNFRCNFKGYLKQILAYVFITKKMRLLKKIATCQ